MFYFVCILYDGGGVCVLRVKHLYLFLLYEGCTVVTCVCLYAFDLLADLF